MPFEIVGVIGLGTMGSGIAQVVAEKGLQVVAVEISPERVEQGMERVRAGLDRKVQKGKLSEADRDAALARISATTDLVQVAGADLVVEAIIEDFAAKARLFRDLDQICAEKTILASNTSSISITRLAAQTQRPEKCIGMHFFNPVPVMPLIEVVRGIRTDNATASAIIEFARFLDKVPVEVRDYPGFVSNRILMPMINEAIYALMEGVASIEAIDTVMRLGMNHPMGPLALADFIGLDVCLAIMRVLHTGLGDDRYRPCPLLQKMVDAGWLGRKTGIGFYRYDTDPPTPNPDL